MAVTRTVSVVLFFAMLVALHQCLAEDAPTASPAPAPTTGADESRPPTPPSEASSPPAPPPLDLGSPAPSPTDADVPSPALDSQVAKDVTQDSTNQEEKSSGRGKKVGIAFGVVAGACVVGLGALVYKKRRDNIRRSQYGQDARGSLL